MQNISLYVFGQSYGGKAAAHFAHHLHQVCVYGRHGSLCVTLAHSMGADRDLKWDGMSGGTA